jgi:hypothetical protein
LIRISGAPVGPHDLYGVPAINDGHFHVPVRGVEEALQPTEESRRVAGASWVRAAILPDLRIGSDRGGKVKLIRYPPACLSRRDAGTTMRLTIL